MTKYYRYYNSITNELCAIMEERKGGYYMCIKATEYACDQWDEGTEYTLILNKEPLDEDDDQNEALIIVRKGLTKKLKEQILLERI